MKTALVVVQGINKDSKYLFRNVKESKWLREKFDKIVHVNTEAEFDKAWFTKLPWVGKSFIGQSIGDVWTFYKNKAARIKICNKVRDKIKELQGEGYTVDALGHSLGCQIILCAGPQYSDASPLELRHCILMGSPLGFVFAPASWKVYRHTKKYSANFHAGKITYLWSKKDPVCNDVHKRDSKLLAKLSNRLHIVEGSHKHDDEKYLKTLKQNYVTR